MSLNVQLKVAGKVLRPLVEQAQNKAKQAIAKSVSLVQTQQLLDCHDRFVRRFSGS
jgi:hypothetical protein